MRCSTTAWRCSTKTPGAQPTSDATQRSYRPLRLVLLADAGTFALTMGVRPSMGLFVGGVYTHTALGLGS
jgi:hypothetical protein